MKVKILFILIVSCLSVTNSARLTRKKKNSYDYEQQQKHHRESQGGGYDYEPVDIPISSSKPGFSEGSGLRSIAQGSADQATSAVANQHAAAKQASYVALNSLSQVASQAAATAQAALQGKQVLLAKIEQQNLEAHQALEQELQQLRQAKRAAKAAQQAAAQAINHVAVLQAALNNAQTASEHAQQAASEASAELASQTQMVGSAKSKVEQLEEQLKSARIDFDATQEAAHKASLSAQEAQNNAAEAAAHASITHVSYTHDTASLGSHISQIVSKSPSSSSSSVLGETELASNHNYGEFKPSNQFSFAGY